MSSRSFHRDRATQFSGPTAARSASAAALKVLGTRCLLMGLIVGIFALSMPHLVLVALACCAMVFVGLSCVRPIHGIGIIVLLNFAYWLISGALSGGLQWASLTSIEFWRGEGRCFLFYLPLLTFSVMCIREKELRFIVKIVCTLTMIGAILCGLWLLGLGHLFQAEVDAETGELRTSTYFIGLLTSHTGAGAFWATVFAFLAAYSLQMRDRRVQLLSIVAAVLTLGTGGRAATLGLLAVVAWLVVRGELINRRSVKLALPVLLLTIAGSWVVIALVPQVSERMVEMFQARTVSSVLHATTREPRLRDATGYFHSGAGLEHHNLVIRVFLWDYALHLFRESPVVGIGFGRFNDTHLEFAGIPHFVNLAVGGETYFGSGIRWERDQLMTSTGNAHNSYLHVLAETGLIGLALLLYLWFLMVRGCASNLRDRSHDQFGAAYCQGCRAAIICLLVTSLAGHALAAPSGGIVLTTMVGAWLAYARDFARGRRNTRLACLPSRAGRKRLYDGLGRPSY